MTRIPLAWKNLTHSIPRLLIAVSGVAFAVVLMFMQAGFRNALFDSTVQPIKEMDADLIVVSRARYSLSRSSRFPLDRLLALRSVEGVDHVRPLYIEMLAAILRRGSHRGRPIRVIGIDVHDCPLDNTDIQAQLGELDAPGIALMDRRSKEIYGFDIDELSAGRPQAGELSDRAVTVAGTFKLGTDFANEGTLIMSMENFARYFPFRGQGRPLSIVDVGLLNVQSGADPEHVRELVRQQLPEGLEVFTRSKFRTREVTFWGGSTPIGIFFGIGTVMGFVVGVIICYQVIFTDISDHMAEFATLKAMGYSERYFLTMIVAESIYLSLFGFVPGLLVSLGLFQLIATTTGLLMSMNLPRAAFILLLTVVMCVISGLIALRKLMAADPASLF